MPTYFEDLTVGEELSFGAYEVTEAEILEFAGQYDPQWFHTDPERARDESIFGDLVASGWHTGSVTMRLLVDHHFSDAASLGAIGIDELRWPNPVYAGETLSVRVEILEARASESNPNRGVVRTQVETANQDGEVKLSMQPIGLYASRERGEYGGGEPDKSEPGEQNPM